MKRRDFLARVALAPVAVGGWLKAHALPESVAFSHFPKRRVSLPLARAERQLLAQLHRLTSECHLFGAPVLSKLAGGSPRWVNLVARFRALPRAKRELFAFGVQPVSTLESPPNFLKFRYADTVYNVFDSDADTFCQLHYFRAREKALPFAHSFLMYTPATRELHDPHGAFEGGVATAFKLVARPPSTFDSLDWVLSSWFESRFLDLPPSTEMRALESATLQTPCLPVEGRFVAERMMNYFPDIVDHLGLDRARTLAKSPLVRQAMHESVGIDFAEAFQLLEQRLAGRSARSARPAGSTGVEFMACVERLGGALQDPALLRGSVGRFMLANNFAFRRPEWLATGPASTGPAPGGLLVA